MKFNPHEIIPAAYVGREQAYIKHLLLDGYLERLLYIVGWSADLLGHEEIIFVDCFAGPWQDDSPDLASTSIAISMNLLSKVQYALKAVGKPVTFRAVYVEKDDQAFGRLESFLSKNSPKNVATSAIHGDFTERIPDILARCPTKSFAFFFVDPKGWHAVKPEILQPLLARPRSEFLINFMYDFVNRAASIDTQREDIDALFDKRLDRDSLSTDPQQRERQLLEHYREALVSRASAGKAAALSGYVTILDPTADRTKYHLIYLTRHPKGVLEFMKQSELLAGVQDVVRTAAKFNKKTQADATGDLFGIDATQVEPSSTSAVISDRMKSLENLWLERISDNPLAVTESVFADLLCRSNCFPSELQLALKALIESNQVKNLNSGTSRRTKNVVNYEKGEKLVRMKP